MPYWQKREFCANSVNALTSITPLSHSLVWNSSWCEKRKVSISFLKLVRIKNRIWSKILLIYNRILNMPYWQKHSSLLEYYPTHSIGAKNPRKNTGAPTTNQWKSMLRSPLFPGLSPLVVDLSALSARRRQGASQHFAHNLRFCGFLHTSTERFYSKKYHILFNSK